VSSFDRSFPPRAAVFHIHLAIRRHDHSSADGAAGSSRRPPVQEDPEGSVSSFSVGTETRKRCPSTDTAYWFVTLFNLTGTGRGP